MDRDRARLYQARARHHGAIGRRRRRDNVIALTVGVLLVAGTILSQTVYYTSGPGGVAPSPSVTPGDPTVVPSLAPTLPAEPEDSPAPTPSP